MAQPINLRLLDCFAAAADAGTMSAAAERLHVSQSAISMSISALEEDLGVQLFIRRRSLGLTLTEPGRAFLQAARDLLAHAEEVRAAGSADAARLAGRLVIGCFQTAAPLLLPRLIETFGDVHPEVELGFIEGTLTEIEAALSEGRCELGLIYDLDVGPSISCEPLYQTGPYVLLGENHPLAARKSIAITDLDGLDMVMLDVHPSIPYMESIFASVGLRPKVRFRSSSHELVRALVARGLGFGMLISRPAGDRSYEGLPLLVKPIRGGAPPIDVALARRVGVRESPRARAFAEHCRTTLRAGPNPPAPNV